MGESARHVANAINTTGLPWSAFDFEVGNISRQQDNAFVNKIVPQIEYNILILNINADQIPTIKAHIPEEIWNNSYKIGVWYWELMEFPDEWLSSFDMVDEVWAPTRFIENALISKATCPVTYMPPGISLSIPEEYDRKQFHLPEDAFLFLNMYDTLSVSSRKNPEAAINAFKLAFASDDLSVGLVVKINNAKMASEKTLLENIKGNYQNIYFITETLSRENVNRLLLCCDVAISLHRSEGLGLLCAEAMYLGKPVIATNWSGNTDFMDETNACMVSYELKFIGNSIGPYAASQKWADANIYDAKAYMIRLYSDIEYYDRIAKAAQDSIRRNNSSQVCGERMKKRLEEIMEQME